MLPCSTSDNLGNVARANMISWVVLRGRSAFEENCRTFNWTLARNRKLGVLVGGRIWHEMLIKRVLVENWSPSCLDLSGA
ncbi:hypothetical protein WG66_008493 [Moniliophthora roreri]|nr:hypothetical protein WG66_008493 [Moniliophthora roreri]